MRVDSGIFVRQRPEPKTIHVREQARGGWALTLDDGTRPISVHPSHADALALAQGLARRGAMIVDHAADSPSEAHEPARAAG